ncbi:MAG: U32 family peptidase [Mariprofundaceae bacterium]
MKIALGPLLFGWPETKIRAFYLDIAGQTEADIFYLGEVVCSKRSISGVPWQIGLAEELQQAGKEVVLSTLAMPTTEAELQSIRDITDAARDMDLSIEANDISAVAIASERGVKFVAGPHLNIYSSGTLRHLCSQGAKRMVLPLEWPARDIPALIQDSGVEVEYFAHGHLPLTFSARCYAARAHGLNKSDCRHVCFMNPDGIGMNTLDADEFATINGTQVMSYRPFSALNQLKSLAGYGVDIHRVSPQAEGTVETIRKFQTVADGMQKADEALQELAGAESVGDAFCNGYYYGKQGRVWIQGG